MQAGVSNPWIIIFADGTKLEVPSWGWIPPPRGEDGGSVVPYSMQIRGCTWNARGLFCARSDRLEAKLGYLQTLLQSRDVLFIQEAHSADYKYLTLDSLINPTHRTFWSNVPSHPNAGGAGFIVNRSFLSQFRSAVFKELDPGRIVSLFLTGPAGDLLLVDVHLDPPAARVPLLRRLHRHVQGYHGAHVLLAGDFNFVSEMEDRFNCATGTFTGNRGNDSDLFAQLFNNFTELYQSDFTHRAYVEATDQTYARLDRIYSSLSPVLLHDLNVSVATHNATSAPRFDLSDHIPVCFFLRPTRTSSAHRSISAWIPRHPLWPRAVLDALDAREPHFAGATDLASIKLALHDAAGLVRDRSANHGAVNTDEKLWWAIRARRAAHAGDDHRLDQACNAYTKLREMVAPIVNTELLDAHIASLARTTAEVKKAEIHANKGLPEFARTQQMDRISRWAALWAPKGRRIGLQGVRSPDSVIISDVAGCHAEVSRYWGGIFAHKPISAELTEAFLSSWAKPLPKAEWRVPQEEFESLLRKLSDSACGPDGIPFSAWARSPPIVRHLLYLAYASWLGSHPLMPNANLAFLALLPKGDHTDDQLHGVHRKASETRPLSLSNTDVKIFASALRVVLERAVREWAHAAQRGFITGRSMLENIIDIETACICHGLGSPATADGIFYDPANTSHPATTQVPTTPAAIFFDFGAAFPSISQDYLRRCLHRTGIPEHIIEAIFQLYLTNDHIWRFGGSSSLVFTVRSGVKQGCPLSAVLFVIAVDPFLRLLVHRIGPHDLCRAYADDIAVVISNLWTSIVALFHAFREFQVASLLEVKAAKCVLVPLWRASLHAVARLLREILPPWANFQVSLAAKYLGVYIGFDAQALTWKTPIAKYTSRCANLLSCSGGLHVTTSLYNVFAVSVTSFCSQLYPLPAELLRAERHYVELLTRGPRHWLPARLAYHLDDVAGMPHHFRHLQFQGLAARARVALVSCQSARIAHEHIQRALYAESSSIAGRFWSWAQTAAATSIHQAMTHPDILRALPRLRRLRQTDDIRVQRWIYNDMRKFHAPVLQDLLRLRWRRWEHLFRSHVLPRVAVDRAARFITQLRGRVPPCVTAAVLNTWFNGWCTARRFQTQGQPCRLLATHEGSDSLEHYACCSGAWESAARHLGIAAQPRTLSRFLGVAPTAGDTPVLIALHVYIIRSMHNAVRSGELAPSQTDEDCSARYRERLRFVCLLHRPLRSLRLPGAPR